jgi:hypothetical protein
MMPMTAYFVNGPYSGAVVHLGYVTDVIELPADPHDVRRVFVRYRLSRIRDDDTFVFWLDTRQARQVLGT